MSARAVGYSSVAASLAILAVACSSSSSTGSASDAGTSSDDGATSDTDSGAQSGDAGACAATAATYAMTWTFDNQTGDGTCTPPANGNVTFPITSPGAGCHVDTSDCPFITVNCGGSASSAYTYVVQTPDMGRTQGANGDIIQASYSVTTFYDDGGDLTCNYKAVPQKQ